MEDGNTMTDSYEQDVGTLPTVHIQPDKFEVIFVVISAISCLCILTIVHWDILLNKLVLLIFVCLVYMLIRAGRACQRASVDSQKLRFYVMGFIPVDVFWKDVSQIGIVYIRGKYDSFYGETKLMGEMFVIVKKPCEKFEKGYREYRWWHLRPKWRHPCLVENIFCKTDKYKEIVERYSQEKISFEIVYQY